MSGIGDNAILIALLWMIAANIAALGPRNFKIGALVVMLISAGLIIPAVIRQNGWIIGFPVALLMLIQMRWAGYFLARLLRRYGLMPSQDDRP